MKKITVFAAMILVFASSVFAGSVYPDDTSVYEEGDTITYSPWKFEDNSWKIQIKGIIPDDNNKKFCSFTIKIGLGEKVTRNCSAIWNNYALHATFTLYATGKSDEYRLERKVTFVNPPLGQAAASGNSGYSTDYVHGFIFTQKK